jgi:bifunctional DNase/RNase
MWLGDGDADLGGIFEANAIAIEIEKMAAPRPDDARPDEKLIHNLNAQLERVVITELKDDTFLLFCG